MANVMVSPGRSGPVDIMIQLETVDETPLRAKGVSVTLSDTETGRELPTMVAFRSGEDGWQVKGCFAIGWKMDAWARYFDFGCRRVQGGVTHPNQMKDRDECQG